MAVKGSTELGKAFEYACIRTLYNQFSKDFNGDQDVRLIEDAPYFTAKWNFTNASSEDKNNLLLAAEAAIQVITRLEPKLQYPDGQIPLTLSIQKDSEGQSGDVRDVLCIRQAGNWVIGLSCKHNHHAVKHSRLSGTIDFGKEWFGYPCSSKYFSTVKPIFGDLALIRDESKYLGAPTLWRDIPDKAETYYIPILNAFVDELKLLASQHSDVPRKLIQYLMGHHDFYKVITDDAAKFTRVEAVNLNGTLGQHSRTESSLVRMPTLRLPDCFYHVALKPNSDNTVLIVCDNGWSLSMRLHSASSKVEPSLKFDVQLVALPNTLYAETEPWKQTPSFNLSNDQERNSTIAAESSIMD